MGTNTKEDLQFKLRLKAATVLFFPLRNVLKEQK